MLDIPILRIQEWPYPQADLNSGEVEYIAHTQMHKADWAYNI